MRISGLATGMDTEQIIKDMMKAHRLPMDKITQKKQYLEWQLDDYRGVNRNLVDFSQNIFDNMILSKNFNQKNVSVSAPDYVDIKNVSSSNEFSGTLNIEQLAKNATLQGGKLKDATNGSTKMKDLDASFAGKKDLIINAINKEGILEQKTVSVNEDDTIDAVLKKINSETGVNAFFDEFTGQIAMTAKNSGAIKGDANSAGIVVEGDVAGLLKLNTADAKTTTGQNAKFTFNGLETERTSNTFQINGFEITLKQADATKQINFSSSPDTEKIFESVVKFIDDYNKLVEDLNKQIREPKYRSFQPLSAEQKKEMSDKEIELWEEKAKSGTLRNDSNISSMLTQMRTALSGSIDQQSLSSIGISTSKNYLDHGKLIINEDKLKEAIASDPSNVHKLFSFDAGKDAKKTEHGLARQLRTIVDDTQKAIAKRAGKVGDVNDTFTLGKNLNDMNKQIERFEERLRMTEDRLWKQFTAMERAIQRSNAQSASLMNAFGGGM
ncbi:flagellar hook-associated protein 2 [Sporosarcina luteola]|uniref:flagellar hook-associated protein 2 n=1 Tax=Sporosarcina luteola TaxID=582850 RepID=UPI00203B21F3|nr:flagellar hook-associated protein 2 [Sporosarcina luteola]MCM3636907.1 flagellar hook-associated protein 2 [Sporosarcina luteola]